MTVPSYPRSVTLVHQQLLRCARQQLRAQKFQQQRALLGTYREAAGVEGLPIHLEAPQVPITALRQASSFQRSAPPAVLSIGYLIKLTKTSPAKVKTKFIEMYGTPG